MKTNSTEVVIILDKSGSMYPLVNDTIGSFNQMLKEQQGQNDSAYLTTVLFDSKINYLHDHIDIDCVKPLTENDYNAYGSTALYDAIGSSINKLKSIVRHTGCEKVLFFIITDGYENCSREYNSYNIKKMIEDQKENGWEFVFMGADIDVIEASSEIGIEANRSVKYGHSSKGMRSAVNAMNNLFRAVREEASLNQPSQRLNNLFAEALDEVSED